MGIFAMKQFHHTAPSHTSHFSSEGGRCGYDVYEHTCVCVLPWISGVHGFHHSFTAKLNFS